MRPEVRCEGRSEFPAGNCAPNSKLGETWCRRLSAILPTFTRHLSSSLFLFFCLACSSLSVFALRLLGPPPPLYVAGIGCSRVQSHLYACGASSWALGPDSDVGAGRMRIPVRDAFAMPCAHSRLASLRVASPRLQVRRIVLRCFAPALRALRSWSCRPFSGGAPAPQGAICSSHLSLIPFRSPARLCTCLCGIAVEDECQRRRGFNEATASAPQHSEDC